MQTKTPQPVGQESADSALAKPPPASPDGSAAQTTRQRDARARADCDPQPPLIPSSALPAPRDPRQRAGWDRQPRHATCHHGAQSPQHCLLGRPPPARSARWGFLCLPQRPQVPPTSPNFPSKSQVQSMSLATPGSSLARAAAPQSRSLRRYQKANAIPELCSFSPTPSHFGSLPLMTAARQHKQKRLPVTSQLKATATAPREPSIPAARCPPTQSSSNAAGRCRQAAMAAGRRARQQGCATPAASLALGDRGTCRPGTARWFPPAAGTATLPRGTWVPAARRLTGTAELSACPVQRGSAATREQRAQTRQIPTPGSSGKLGSPCARNCTATPSHHPPSPSAGSTAPGKSPGGGEVHEGFLQTPKAARLAPLSRQAALQSQECASSRQTPTSPRHTCAVSRARSTLGAGRPEIYDTTVHPGHSALPAKVWQEAPVVGRKITGEGREESRLLNIQRTTSSSATARGEPAQWMH